MALWSTKPLTEMTNRNLSRGKGQPARKADLTAIFEPIVYTLLTTLWASTTCYSDSFTFTYGFE
jgi:hypothetical protein